MAKMVPAWDKRTGKQLPNPVPKKWLDKGTFKNLAATPQGAASAARTTSTTAAAGKSDQKGA